MTRRNDQVFGKLTKAAPDNIEPEARSGDNVGQQLVFEQYDLVFQAEFFAFQPGDLQLINGGMHAQRHDRIVKIAMFGFQFQQLCTKALVIH